jgi:Protein of unknown function (DUF5131)
MQRGTQLRAVPSSRLAAPTATPCAWPRVWMPWDKRNIRGSRDGAVAGPSGPARYELTKTLWLFLRRGQNHEKCSSIQCRIYSTKLPAGFIRRVWDVMGGTPRHTYQILTKRPDRMAELLSGDGSRLLPNVWLGTSVEDGRVLDRLDDLRAVPAAVRFVSFEPLIGSVAGSDLRGIHWAM